MKNRMKIALVALTTCLTYNSLACEFQGEQHSLVKAKEVECNEVSGIATIKNPQIDIAGEFYNITAAYGVEEEYLDIDHKSYSWFNGSKDVVTKKLKTRTVSHFISSRSRSELCQYFGFSGHYSSRRDAGFDYKKIFSYFHKAYSMDHSELFRQSLNHAPLAEIKCRK